MTFGINIFTFSLASNIQIRLLMKRWERESKLEPSFAIPIDKNAIEMVSQKFSQEEASLKPLYQLSTIVRKCIFASFVNKFCQQVLSTNFVNNFIVKLTQHKNNLLSTISLSTNS